MGKHYLTASSGAGKLSVITTVPQSHGYTAYDTERVRGTSRLIDTNTGKITDFPDEPIDWKRYSWSWRRPAIEQSLVKDDPVFLAAVMFNQHEFYQLFDRIFVITLNEETLRHWQLTRTTKDYRKHSEELAGIIQDHATHQTQFLSEPKAVAVNVTRNVQQVVNEILSCVL